MAKLIRQCCVCNTVMGATQCNVDGVAHDEEKISHGYCGDACANATEVRLMDFNSDGESTVERGFMVGEKLYYRGMWVDCFIRINNNPVMAEMRAWDAEMEFYDVFTTFNTGSGDIAEAEAHGKSWAQAEEMVLMLS